MQIARRLFALTKVRITTDVIRTYVSANNLQVIRTYGNLSPNVDCTYARYSSKNRKNIYLDYCSPVWNPHYRKDKLLLARVQHRFTRQFDDLKNLPYSDRVNKLRLWSLEERRNHTDLIELFSGAYKKRSKSVTSHRALATDTE